MASGCDGYDLFDATWLAQQDGGIFQADPFSDEALYRLGEKRHELTRPDFDRFHASALHARPAQSRQGRFRCNIEGGVFYGQPEKPILT